MHAVFVGRIKAFPAQFESVERLSMLSDEAKLREKIIDVREND